MNATDSRAKAPQSGNWVEVFAAFLRLGLTSFGGPVAHLGYFREEFVVRRRWLDERAFVDLVALCQFLPGPASSEVGIGIGLSRASYAGALAAWTGFTLPSAIAMVLFALGTNKFSGIIGSGALHGLKIAAVAVVALAVWGMAGSMARGKARATLTAVAAVIALLMPNTAGQLAGIGIGAVFGVLLLRGEPSQTATGFGVNIRPGLAAGCLLTFFVLLFGLPLAADALPFDSLARHSVAMFSAFYRAGALVFGGGHVVLPLLQAAVVPPGWVTNDAFLAGYGAAQAVPGPLFTFSAYLGAAMATSPNGIVGAAICLAGIFLPAFLLVIGTLPFWHALRHKPAAQAALAGVNAAVVGVLLAALYNPVWRNAIETPSDFAFAVTALLLLAIWKTPPWLVVALCAAGGAVLITG